METNSTKSEQYHGTKQVTQDVTIDYNLYLRGPAEKFLPHKLEAVMFLIESEGISIAELLTLAIPKLSKEQIADRKLQADDFQYNTKGMVVRSNVKNLNKFTLTVDIDG